MASSVLIVSHKIALLYLSVLIVLMSGITYGMLRYMVKPIDERLTKDNELITAIGAAQAGTNTHLQKIIQNQEDEKNERKNKEKKKEEGTDWLGITWKIGMVVVICGLAGGFYYVATKRPDSRRVSDDVI